MTLQRTSFRLLVIAMLAVTASCADDATRGSANSVYRFSTRSVIQSDDGLEASGYFATMVQRPDEPPWLLVAKPMSVGDQRFMGPGKEGFTTHSSAASVSISIDGQEYAPESGKCIVALHTDRGYTSRLVTVSEDATLSRMANGSFDLTLVELERLLSVQHEAEP